MTILVVATEDLWELGSFALATTISNVQIYIKQSGRLPKVLQQLRIRLPLECPGRHQDVGIYMYRPLVHSMMCADTVLHQ